MWRKKFYGERGSVVTWKISSVCGLVEVLVGVYNDETDFATAVGFVEWLQCLRMTSALEAAAWAPYYFALRKSIMTWSAEDWGSVLLLYDARVTLKEDKLFGVIRG